MRVTIEATRRIVLHGGAVALEPGARATVPLGLACHLARNNMIQPGDDDAHGWINLGLLLQAAIPATHCGTRARRRAGRERAALMRYPGAEQSLAMALP
ncbi:MAG TPA: hypothetical protein PKB14_22115 [Rubrivivax sp.]|nr:hypothetical protein [Rubrivivax sp.]